MPGAQAVRGDKPWSNQLLLPWIHGNYRYEPKVGSLKTRGSCLGDIQSLLEMFVQSIEQTVREAPQEEEAGHETNRVQRLSQGQFGSASPVAVTHLQAAFLPEGGHDVKLVEEFSSQG
ncbi:unnamed protein product [Aspergillus oryzae]|nr:unnamed protein product [Aspergillus oryzae]